MEKSIRDMFPSTLPCKTCGKPATLSYTSENKREGTKEGSYRCGEGHSSMYALPELLYLNVDGKKE